MRITLLKILLRCAVLLIVIPVTSQAEDAIVAAASNFMIPLKALKKQFEQQTGHRLTLVFGSSGKIYTQITHGAPFDMFLSADNIKPAALEQAGFAEADSRFIYAIGKIALWSTRPDILASKDVLFQKGAFNKLAIANPKLAPYGFVTKYFLESLDLYDTLRPKIIQGENIAQTYQFIATGNADLGFVSVSQLYQGNDIETASVWVVPTTLYPSLHQEAILLKKAHQNQAAQSFWAFLKSDQAQNLIKGFGYSIMTEKE